MANYQEFRLPHFEETAPYGFVIDHPAYWGIPIPGFPSDRQPAQPTDPVGVPSSLTVSNASLDPSSLWTGGNISILATRTPPLFHSFHHKTNEALAGRGHSRPGGSPFERRAENRIVERSFSPRSPLPGQGRFATVHLFNATFESNGQPQPITSPSPIPFSSFDTRALIKQAQAAGYFETRLMTWNVDLVGPLNALWLVILKAGSPNTPLERLEGGYRLWHHLHRDDDGNEHKRGYDWQLSQRNNYQELCFVITLSGKLNGTLKQCPSEKAILEFELTWQT